MPTPKRVSQQSIARELGVSQALVSLALNGRREGINPETYKRIWDYAMKAGYQPKGIKLERSPAEALTRQVGVILRAGLNLHTQGSYFSHVFHGLHTALTDEGYTTAFLGSEDSLNATKLAQFFGPGHALRGVILLGEVSASFMPMLRRLEPRIVAISARHPGFCHSVLGNEPQALDAIVDHLFALGHRRIGWLGGNVGLGRHEMRQQALKTAMIARGLTPDPRYDALRQEGDRSEGSEALLQLLPLAQRPDFPTAFVTYNVQMAIGASLAAERAGLPVGKTLSIAAADFSLTATTSKPTITSAGCDPIKLGETAARLLLDSHGEEAEGTFHDLVLASKLHSGESTGPAPA